ncbi:adrenodoxin mitochondrial isoform B [Micractinium conductrix]|uniref:2Fe-2S ferredoxin n=1 Tax=Micractinium conductrix TaxID=554055 RepID=A0A2P6VB54_9CHLO|nr:adrenodoxin mitochondrial isoform B [Micractinium conductrix]|eukprot:PSC71313.1 adrenodoxin mitochondrial isoform B [Micractinium conductrix]
MSLRTLSRALAGTLLPLGTLQQAPGGLSSAAAAAASGGGWRHAWRRFSAAAEGEGETISVTFKDEKDGSEKTVRVPLGKSLLEAAHDNEVELEGACEGSLACSTCHVIVEDQEYYDKLPEPDDDENDMLDLAFGLTDTSRLGCQIKASKDLEGVTLPPA